jgi:serine/threonine protein kinase/TolB-like protein/Tfp pilus assembly protein PilF
VAGFRILDPVRYCPQCAARYDEATDVCPRDNTPLERVDRLLGAVLDGKYRVEALLGAGAMGSVYRATQLNLGRTVAIKVIRDDLLVSRSAAERFRREAAAVARLKHPNIVTVFDTGFAPDVGAYTVMEHLEGRSLKDELRASGPFRPGRAIALVRQICSALDAAHAVGIVHRDLKPQNVFLERTSAGAVPKVLDFGIAKVDAPADSHGASLTGSGVILGTPLYMAPEQCENLPVDARTDIYAIGCVLYELLTGRTPFVGASVPMVLIKHVSERPKAPSHFMPAIPPALDAVVLRALEKAPADRFQTAGEMARALAAAGVDEEPLDVAWDADVATGFVDLREPRTSGALAELRSTPHNLPARRSAVGRDDATASEVHNMLAEARALTITAPDGPERTRLAEAVAADALGEFPDGVWAVEVGPLSSETQLERAVAAVLGVSSTSHGEPLTSIAQFLRGKRVLLVLEGCDRLAPACASLAAALLATCPGLRVLATSDTALGIGGERTFAPDGAPGGTAAVATAASHGATGTAATGAETLRMPHSSRRRAAMAAVVATIAAAAAIAAYLVATRSGPSVDSVAVLPFATAAADPDAEYLGDGIAERIIDELSQLPGVRVMARTTVFRYKGKDVDPREVGRELGVKAVLAGRVTRRDGTVNIQVELVDAATGSQLWGKQYTRASSDVLSAQEDIARQISERLTARLVGDTRRRLEKHETASGDAYQAYLRGRFYLARQNEADWRKAVAAFEEAVDLDPRYALAHAGLADAYIAASNVYIRPADAMARARAEAERALTLDDELAEAHAALAQIRFYYDWDWPGAEATYRRAIDLNPGYAEARASHGFTLTALGRFDEAIAEMEEARRLDPLSMPLNRDIGSVYFFARRYDRAVDEYRRALELDPGFTSLHTALGTAYMMQGRHTDALAELEAAGDPDDSPRKLAVLALAHATSGQRDVATRELEALVAAADRGEFVSPVSVARVYAALGRSDGAFEWLERAYQARSDTLVWLRVDPRFDPIRSDPRFDDLVGRVTRRSADPKDDAK